MDLLPLFGRIEDIFQLRVVIRDGGLMKTLA